MAKGAYEVHEELKRELQTYIKSQYFSKSPLLHDSLDHMLSEEGVIFQQPFIESSPAYLSIGDGISKSNLALWKKEFLNALAESNLGVFSSPFKHQIDALQAVDEGKDLFVSTGTGSGKTECFLWPLLIKLAQEAKEQPDTWEQRAVRVILMYPMNALVSDQVSRLRKLIGDPEQKFLNIFKNVCGRNARRPQFGMYTGRTPYPGSVPSKAADKELQNTLSRMVLSQVDETERKYLQRLITEGKVPAKVDLGRFVEKIQHSQHYPDEEDAELVTRFEMQAVTPDILITNYSMLEYMLLRPREENIWDDTKKWLNESDQNKLLFIIDEAHMYKGSSGGEVALLIRRLFEKLDITRKKVQFILTTASMPDRSEGDRNAVMKFAYELTASDELHNFCYLTGEKETNTGCTLHSVNNDIFAHFTPEMFEQTDQRLNVLNEFWKLMDSDFQSFQSEVFCPKYIDHKLLVLNVCGQLFIMSIA
ncbi:MAG: DEAD/DEAH box helicase [Solobacterium sp.]|nr:DEAD/DEAH box helicase [Solobacterium sp.]